MKIIREIILRTLPASTLPPAVQALQYREQVAALEAELSRAQGDEKEKQRAHEDRLGEAAFAGTAERVAEAARAGVAVRRATEVVTEARAALAGARRRLGIAEQAAAEQRRREGIARVGDRCAAVGAATQRMQAAAIEVAEAFEVLLDTRTALRAEVSSATLETTAFGVDARQVALWSRFVWGASGGRFPPGAPIAADTLSTLRAEATPVAKWNVVAKEIADRVAGAPQTDAERAA